MKKMKHWLWIPLLTLAACGADTTCRPPVGHWTDREGRDLVFESAGQALWLTRFGSQTDTQHCQFEFDCQQSPPQLDLKNFTSGPFAGKTLFGIVEWSHDSAFRWQYDYDARPHTFEADAEMQFFKK
jgi:hypothetical protein